MKFLTKLLLLSCFALAFIFANNNRAKTSKSLNESVNKNVSFKEVDREESKEMQRKRAFKRRRRIRKPKKGLR